MKRFTILDLKPTQFALGMLEVERKIRKYSKLGRKQLQKKVRKDYITLAKGPDKNYYIIDGHHHLCVFFELGIKKVYAKIEKDFSKDNLTFSEFWKEMSKKDYCHLYDQFGEGPRDPIYLPKDIRGLGDDPYRSLAWLIKKEGIFDDSKKPHADFIWSNFFRKKKLLEEDFQRHFHQAKMKALKLAKSREAQQLPGR